MTRWLASTAMLARIWQADVFSAVFTLEAWLANTLILSTPQSFASPLILAGIWLTWINYYFAQFTGKPRPTYAFHIQSMVNGLAGPTMLAWIR